MDAVRAFYEGKTGDVPEYFGPIIVKEEMAAEEYEQAKEIDPPTFLEVTEREERQRALQRFFALLSIGLFSAVASVAAAPLCLTEQFGIVLVAILLGITVTTSALALGCFLHWATLYWRHRKLKRASEPTYF